MPTKLDQVRRLLSEGFELDEVVTSGPVMEVRLARRGQKTIVKFLPSEAEALLLAGPLRLEPSA